MSAILSALVELEVNSYILVSLLISSELYMVIFINYHIGGCITYL